MSGVGMGHTGALYGSASSMNYSASLGHGSAPIRAAEGHTDAVVRPDAVVSPDDNVSQGRGLMAACAYSNYYTTSVYSWCND
jgi:hypothetical protein